MKILYEELKRGEVKIKVTNLDDLWYLSQIIENGDKLVGKTTRKIKIGTEPNVKLVKKTITLEIEVEKVEFSKTSNVLRVGGKVSREMEGIPKGSYHTIKIEENSVIKIIKKEWLGYQINIFKRACEEKRGNILICVHDRERVGFALLKPDGWTYLTEIEGEVEKKTPFKKIKKEGIEFYKEIANNLNAYVERFNPVSVIIASPAFFKEDLLKIINEKYPNMKKKIILATCSSVGKAAINEILKREEIKTALKKERIIYEIGLVEDFFKELAKDGLACYGFDEVKKAVEYGAVKLLLVVDEIILKYREEGKYEELEMVMKEVEKKRGEVHLISSVHEGGKRLKAIGGICAILRYKIN